MTTPAQKEKAEAIARRQNLAISNGGLDAATAKAIRRHTKAQPQPNESGRRKPKKK